MDDLGLSRGSLIAPDSERSLLQRLKDRDPDVIGQLYDRYGRTLYFSCLRIVNNPGVAEDLVQETFLRAWNRAATLGIEYGSVGPWLVSIARHCSLDYQKSMGARTAAITPITDGVLPPTTIDGDLLSSERVRVLSRALQTLSSNYRIVLELAYYEDYHKSKSRSVSVSLLER